MSKVEVRVQPIAQLRERYPEAVRELIPQVDVLYGRRHSPSSDPAHVFDTPNGWRLIVSREQLLSGRIGVHLSVSSHWPMTERQGTPATEIVREILLTYREISGIARTPELITVTEGGVPHWWIEQVS